MSALHPADRLTIDGLPVPQDLRPLDVAAEALVPLLVRDAVRLPLEGRAELLQRVRALPQLPRAHLCPAPRVDYKPSFGATLVLLLHNRNLAWTGAAKVLGLMTGEILAVSTIGAIGSGRRDPVPDLLVPFATVLGIPAATLAGIARADPPDEVADPAMADVAALIWEARRLTLGQIQTLLG